MIPTLPLSKAQEHSLLHIASIKTASKTLLRLMGLGLVPGKDIEVLRNRRGDIVLSCGNSRISLGESVANKIHVHTVDAFAASEMQTSSIKNKNSESISGMVA